jgi:hypothetical protein
VIPVGAVSAALAALPIHHEDRANPFKGAQLHTVAQAVAAVSRDLDEAALLIAIGHHETKLSFRVHFGLCRAFECDRGRAVSPWQLWQNGRATEEWHGFVGISLDATKAAAGAAVRHVRFAQRVCRGEPEPIVATFRAYAGIGCRVPLKDERARLATFRAVRGRLG